MRCLVGWLGKGRGATPRDLPADVQTGRFREDLFHRLAVGILRLPPLRDRGPDVPLLMRHFLEVINRDAHGRPEAQTKELADDALQLLCTLSWPGDVREAYHTLLRATLWSNGEVVTGEDVRASIVIASSLDRPKAAQLTKDGGFSLRAYLDDVARDHITRAMAISGNRKTQAAELLGFPSHQTLNNWMRRLEHSDQDPVNSATRARPRALSKGK